MAITIPGSQLLSSSPWNTIHQCARLVGAPSAHHTGYHYAVLACCQQHTCPPCLPLRCPVARLLQRRTCGAIIGLVLCLATTSPGFAKAAMYGRGTDTDSAEPTGATMSSQTVELGTHPLARHPDTEGPSPTPRESSEAKGKAKDQGSSLERESARTPHGHPQSSNSHCCHHMRSRERSTPGLPMRQALRTC